MLGYIYKITSPNGKIYIGQTINLKKRFNEYGRKKFSAQSKLWNNCISYDWNPNDKNEDGRTLKYVELLEVCDVLQLDEKEIYYINLYSSFDSNHGLNLTIGGKGNSVVSDEVKQKISNTNKGRKFSEELKAQVKEKKVGKPGNRKGTKHSKESLKKISESLKGKPGYWQDKKMSEEARNKMSESKKGKPSHRKDVILSEETKKKISESKKGGITHNAKKIYQYDINKKLMKIWPNITSIKKELHISHNRFTKHLNNDIVLFNSFWFDYLLQE